MAGLKALQISKNTTETLKEMGLSTRGDLSPENALFVHSYDMRNLFREGDKVCVRFSELKRSTSDSYGSDGAPAQGMVVGVTKRLVTVRYAKEGWTECFSILDYLGKKINLVHH
ncbi:MAG: hypothetical protein IJI65_00885 [Lachnospiraceae bacterium]|nr:hypothetical protein [Lachnospiraceae bacterium]